MPDITQDPLRGLSDALLERVRGAQPLVARIEVEGRSVRSGTLWRKDVVVAADQAFARVDEAKVVLGDGSSFSAHLAGRDPGTNVIAFRLDGAPEPAPLAAGEPHPGALALAFGADEAGASVRVGVIHSVGPAWHSRAGGRIDQRIVLDMTMSGREEGGPVLDAGGSLLGISTLGPRRRVLVIPATTVEGVLEPLLSTGRVERGWLGLALQPVLVPETMQASVSQCLYRGGNAVMNERIHLLDVLRRDEFRRVEVADLAGDARRKRARVKMRDRPDAAGAGDDIAPCRRNVVADRADDAQSGNHYTPFVHI